ncbi:MAG: ATP-binding protein [Luteimonas sp.]
MDSLSVNIRPEVTILSVLKHLNYRPWFALAEFVDNSIESFFKHRDSIRSVDGAKTKLKVWIEIDTDGPGRIVVRDNAAGISAAEFPRAFRAAEVPLDRSGLSEFGMGMKSAACWFAESWTVRTKALHESVERVIIFDIDEIVSRKSDVLPVAERLVGSAAHYTEITLAGLHHPPKGGAIRRIKEHLASIYRVFLRDGDLEISFKGELLEFHDPKILVAPFYREPTEAEKTWKKEINLDFGEGQKVKGFAALRETASTPYAGFALFRRQRLIEGSADETYRPIQIFGNSNSYRFQRLFGELHLDGFEVSHTKDGFRWEQYEEEFLQLLKEELEAKPMNLLDQAEGHRVRVNKKAIESKARTVTESVAADVANEVPPLIDREAENPHEAGPLPLDVPPSTYEVGSKTVLLDCAKQKWEVCIRTTVDPAEGDWLRIAERYVRHQENGERFRCVTIDVSLAHPFVTEFLGANSENIELIVRMAAGVALSLLMAEDATGTSPNFALHYLNILLRDALTRA